MKLMFVLYYERIIFNSIKIIKITWEKVQILLFYTTMKPYLKDNGEDIQTLIME